MWAAHLEEEKPSWTLSHRCTAQGHLSPWTPLPWARLDEYKCAPHSWQLALSCGLRAVVNGLFDFIRVASI
jgi:hypothetical protein